MIEPVIPGIVIAAFLIVVGIWKQSVYSHILATIAGAMTVAQAYASGEPILSVATLAVLPIFAMIESFAYGFTVTYKRNGENGKRRGA
jgi:hypothetical protein